MKKELLQVGSKCISKKPVVIFSDPDFDNFSKKCVHVGIESGIPVKVTKLPFKHSNIQFIEFQIEPPYPEEKFFLHWITFKGSFNLV